MSVHFKVLTPHDGIDSDASAEAFQFPGGEWHLRDFSDTFKTPKFTWIADLRGAQPEEIIQAAMFADIAHGRQAPFVLLLPYLPAARADRGEPLGARVYGNLINAMNPQQVIGIDPHSPIVERYVRNLTVLDPTPLVTRVLSECGHHYQGVIAPDKGAVPRAEATAKALGLPLYRIEKHRDFDTGKITGMEIIDELNSSDQYLVVDDICDGGRTFMELAKITGLPKEQLGLWVTHGIFSGNAPALREHYGRIYTTDSHPGHNRIEVGATVFPVFLYLFSNIERHGL